MKTYEDCFSIDEIVRELCKERIRLTSARHEALYHERISAGQPPSDRVRRTLADDLGGLFPSRRLWAKFRSKRQERKGKSVHAVNLDALFGAVRVLMKKEPDLPWVDRLLARAENIQFRALEDDGFRFTPPSIVGVPKEPGKHVYRPVSIYFTDDKIIDKITFRYLRDKLDFCLSPSSLAFRARQSGQSRAITHHDVLDEIISFRNQHPRLFVAEADLRSFMDCVDHETARGSLRDVIHQAKGLRQDLEISPRAIEIYDAYLASYSYKREVLGSGLSALRKKDPHASFSWPEEVLRQMHGSEDDLTGIGIPQGGALSCFITNIMLHEVDQAVEKTQRPDGSKIKYFRFCDDMIILSPDAATCRAAMAAYQEAVHRAKLPIHEPVDVSGYLSDSKSRKKIWGLKSKMAYLWAPGSESGIPWIQFVGYQIRYDCLVRIRAKSMKKHRQKLTDATDKILSIINPGSKSKNGVPVYATGLKMTGAQIEKSHTMKLIALSVGRLKFGRALPSSGFMPMCWANGFRGLWGVRFVSTQLKEMDRHRERQMRRLRSRLRHLSNPDVRIPDNAAAKRKKPVRYYGAPFSYHGQFVRSKS